MWPDVLFHASLSEALLDIAVQHPFTYILMNTFCQVIPNVQKSFVFILTAFIQTAMDLFFFYSTFSMNRLANRDIDKLLPGYIANAARYTFAYM